MECRRAISSTGSLCAKVARVHTQEREGAEISILTPNHETHHRTSPHACGGRPPVSLDTEVLLQDEEGRRGEARVGALGVELDAPGIDARMAPEGGLLRRGFARRGCAGYAPP
ncbi:hypothetical protein MFU01_47320 [Myxococcus fulvus]|uniref:Uncharacterized protein n=1 Tax=Myxococcus fulvus TaxID=33 RepID=A0A511T6A5_MYXFU|nr:hypothetical protein MFU01_47320 [Myxococcus fulvus]